VGNIETSWMFLNVLENTNSTDVISSNGQDTSTILELDQTVNFSCFKIVLYILNINYLKKNKKKVYLYLDSVILLNIWVRISNGSSIMSNDVWNLVGSHSLSFDLAKFELGFLGIDLVSLVSSFDIVKNTEVLASLLN
jgi:hypothetical protein